MSSYCKNCVELQDLMKNFVLAPPLVSGVCTSKLLRKGRHLFVLRGYLHSECPFVNSLAFILQI